MSKYGKPYYKVLRVKTEPSDYFWIQNATGNDNQFFVFSKQGNPSGKVEYSKDKTNWVKITDSTTWIYFNNNEKVYFRGTNGFSSSASSYYYFSLQCDVNAGGNIGRLVNWTENLTILPDFSLYKLFQNSNLKDISQITFETIKKIGRYSLFQSFWMQLGLTSGAPDFSSIEEVADYGLQQTFQNSTLTSTGDFSSLKTVGLSGMYQMFQSCTTLTTGMDLSNVTSVGSEGLRNCYSSCTHISEVTAPNIQDLTANDILYNWLSGAGIQASGTKTVFVPTGATITTDSISGIPTGWTRVDY